MNVTIFNEPFPHIIVNNTFDELEQKLIWEELIFLSHKMLPPEMTATARDSLGRMKKRGAGIFLDGVYVHPEMSTISHTSGKLFQPLIIDSVSNKKNHFSLRSLVYVTNRKIYVQMYKNGDYYDTHADSQHFTVVTLFHKIPKKYSGGVLGFPDYDFIPELNHNSTIFFPSCIEHYVTEVKLDSDENQDARFTITQFTTLGG